MYRKRQKVNDQIVELFNLLFLSYTFLRLVFWTCFSSLTWSLNDIKKEMELEDITCDIKYRSAGLSLEQWHWEPFYGLHRPCTPCMF